MPYRVVYSERVRHEARTLIERAQSLGRAQEVLDAIKRIDYLLSIYPQFGDPLQDLVLVPARLWIGTVPPLVVRYVLNEDTKLVMVPVAFVPLPRSDF